MRTAIPVVLFSLAAAASAAQDAAPAPAPAAAPAPSYYRIELAPSGSYVAIGAPVAKPTSVVFHAYPDGKLMMLRKTDVRKISPITAQEAAAPAKKDLVSIGNLAMQGGGAPAGASGVHTATSGPGAARGGSSSGQGPAVVQTRDGLAITTGSTAAAAAVAGPAVTSTHDGMVVSAQPPHK